MVNRDDDLPDDVYQRREVFAHYGAAMFHAQVLEQGLVNALTFAQTATHRAGTQQPFDFNFDANLSVTMGGLLHRIEPFLNGDTELLDKLAVALKLRNRFAHSFWVDHDKNFFSFAGREKMMVDAIEAQETFQAVDARLTPVLNRYLDSLRIAPEDHAATVAEAFDSIVVRRARTASAVNDGERHGTTGASGLGVILTLRWFALAADNSARDSDHRWCASDVHLATADGEYFTDAG